MRENIARNIRTGDYLYDLPDEKIARYPLQERDQSKLLIFRDGFIEDDIFKNIGRHLGKGTTLVFNNTRVIRARLLFRKETGASIEIFCLEPFDPSDYQLSLTSANSCSWICLVGNSKKWKQGSVTMNLLYKGEIVKVSAERLNDVNDGNTIRFSWEHKTLTMAEILEGGGHIPVPPYLGRDDEAIDTIRYQTVYSETDGSVAAPTAGLHFTESLIDDLMASGIKRDYITLHVGAGTFVPVKTETIGGHEMHTEHFSVTRTTIQNLLSGRVIAVGTTTVRTLESIYWLGVMLLESDNLPDQLPSVSQWIPYQEHKREYSVQEAIGALESYMELKRYESAHTSTSVIIVPGYRFRIVKGVITNYHMPGSTLLLLVSALVGDSWRSVYDHALDNNYRFLSYGDSSLLLP
ncbi:MAG: S-adenosylmethionine:tRNA ribosyltransferase-isomerase [Bacteroidales bacterium]|nr:S-adenosylmethionine:tRNA ribosyltransferase-isomerase [Bacteroidales bacterium]